MLQIKQKLIKEVSAVLGTKFKASDLTDPPKVDMGEFALPCFALAKEFKKNPAQIATEFAVKLNEASFTWLDKAQAVGPYVNFFIKPQVWVKEVLFDLIKEKKHKLAKQQKIMIEYSQPNTHKVFHVGHLRNACLGSAVVNILRYLGQNVIAATYVNNVGAHVAKTLWNYMNFHASDDLPTNKGKYLGDIYAEADEKIAENEEYKAQVADIILRLEQDEKEITKIWKETQEWSLQQFRQIYDELNMKFDYWYYENENVKKARKIVKKLIKQGIAKESEGAIIADLTKYNLDILVLLRSDGRTLYSTTDLALAHEKAKKKAETSIVIVDNRQAMYFKQVFKVLELMGFGEKMVHVPYEFVTLPSGAMSSRKGNIIAYEDFRDLILDKMIEKTKERHLDWPAGKLDDVAAAVALSAIKFGMLKYENNSVVVFDMDAAISTEGATGPYLLYTVARFNSIVRKVPAIKTSGKLDLNLLKEFEEKDLIKHLSKFDEIVEVCAKKYDPSGLCTYLLGLSQKMNTFYHKCQIIKAADELRHARLVLVSVALATMKRGLGLLNIETVEEM